MASDVVVHARKTPLNQAPESLNRVRVNVARDVDLGAVIDSMMLVSACAESDVSVPFVCENHSARKNVLFDDSFQRGSLRVIGQNSLDAALPLRDADHGLLAQFVAGHRATAAALALAAEIGFVNLNLARELAAVASRPDGFVIQHGANLLEHAPRGFVGHACLTLNLLCRDAAARLRHEVDRVEPQLQRRGRLVKDRVRRGVDVVTAVVARVGRAARYAVMQGLTATLDAVRSAVRVEAAEQPLQTRGIVRELLLKVPERERLHVWLGVRILALWLHDLTCFQGQMYPNAIPTVKG